MPKRKDSFARALSDAEKRLEKALAERTAAQRRLAELEREVPTLQITVAALRSQIDPTKVPEFSQSMIPGRIYTDPPPNLTPEELAKWYLGRDLSNVGSVPPAIPVAPSAPVSEDDLLPDDFEVKK